jgi:hypothetical protein
METSELEARGCAREQQMEQSLTRVSPQGLVRPRGTHARALLALLSALCGGCEQVAKLDELYIEQDAATVDEDDAGTPPEEDAGPDQYAALRELCVDTINQHRATLSLPALARANTTQERCADEGAETDSAMNTPHYAAQQRSEGCQHVGLGPENSCPNWRFGAGQAHTNASDALVACIERMWDQGMPPIPVEDCSKDLAPDGCFAQHGEWINLTSTRAKFVACGIAQGDDAIWINQDFTAR